MTLVRQPEYFGASDLTWVLDAAVQGVTFADHGVTTESFIGVAVRVADGREADELDMDPLLASPGVVTPGVGFTVLITPANDRSTPEGAYRVLVERH